MLCRVEMPSHEALFGRFYRWKLMHLGSGKIGLFGMPVLVALLAVAMLGFGMGLPLILALLAIIGLYLVYSLYMRPASIFRKKEGAALQTEVYVFTENSFTRSVRSEEGGLPDNTSSQYSVLSSAVETSKDFYLFTGPTQAYLVDKAYFTKGTPEDLRATLQKALGDKFKTKQR